MSSAVCCLVRCSMGGAQHSLLGLDPLATTLPGLPPISVSAFSLRLSFTFLGCAFGRVRQTPAPKAGPRAKFAPLLSGEGSFYDTCGKYSHMKEAFKELPKRFLFFASSTGRGKVEIGS